MFDQVFASYPDVSEIWAVGDMPFLSEREARNFAVTQKEEPRRVLRPAGNVSGDEAAPAQPGKAPRGSQKAKKIAG